MNRVALLAPLALAAAACQDEVPDFDPRPPIEVVGDRCTAAEIVSMGRPQRFQIIDDGRLTLWGHDDLGTQKHGRILYLDLTGRQPPSDVWVNFALRAIRWHDGYFYASATRPTVRRVRLDGTSDPYAEFPTMTYSGNDSFAITDDGDVILSYRLTYPEPVSGVTRFGPLHEVRWTTGLIGDDGTRLFNGEFRFHELVGDAVVSIGTSVDDFEGDRITFIEWYDAESGATKARAFDSQLAVEPMRIVVDRAGEPVLLALEGHSGERYQRGKPYAARIGRDAVLTDRRDIPLPDGISHGALLAGVELDDGWLYGGSVCGRGRGWCDAWVVRMRGDEVVWSQRLMRSVAATVTDLHVDGDRVLAAVASSRYCCEFRDFDHDGWLWELDLGDGACATPSSWPVDGQVLR